VRARTRWGDATIKTLLGRLMRKGAITTERLDKRQRYRAAFSREAYVDAECRALANRLFGGDMAAMAEHLAKQPTRLGKPD
jgi:BlaI family penicillinase repressor